MGGVAMRGALQALALASFLPAAACAEAPNAQGPHRGAAIEWWLAAGHLRATDGRWFAFQAGFYRFDVDVEAARSASRVWDVRSIYPAFFAVTDLTRQTFHATSSIERDGPSTASREGSPVRLRQREWSLVLADSSWALSAGSSDAAVELTLDASIGPLPVGAHEAGGPRDRLSRLVTPRLVTEGTLLLEGERLEVRGISTLEQAFGAAHADSGGWNAVDVHLRDGAELVLFASRGAQGNVADAVDGLYLTREREVVPLGGGRARLYPIGTKRWASPSGTASYPMVWRVEVPDLDLRLDLAPEVLDQEIRARHALGADLWRGAIVAQGRRRGETISGAGFLELAGYAGAFPPRLDAPREPAHASHLAHR